MKVKIKNTTRIELTDMDNYDPDKIDMCLRKLNEKMQNKCFYNAYILEVTRVIKASEIMFSLDSTVRGTLSCMFEANAIVFDSNEIILAEIVKKEEKFISALVGNFAGVNIHPPVGADIYKVGQTVPVLVQKADYILGKEEVSITAIPFIPHKLPMSVIKVTEGEIADIRKLEAEILVLEKQWNVLENTKKIETKFVKKLLETKALKGTPVSKLEVGRYAVDWSFPTFSFHKKPVNASESKFSDVTDNENNKARFVLNERIKQLHNAINLTKCDLTMKPLWKYYLDRKRVL
jgi:hypothetical protein